MNFTESFSEFSSKLGPTDLALYAGAGIVLWVLFKDKLSPVQKFVLEAINRLKSKTAPVAVTAPILTTSPSIENDNKGLFFDLVVSWKQTRDLAEKSGCKKAVEVADQMFPYLSPMVCEEVESNEK